MSRRLICARLERESGRMVTNVDDSELVSLIQDNAPDLVILDVHAPAIRLASTREALGIKSAPVTIVTAYDSSAVSAFASTAIDFLVNHSILSASKPLWILLRQKSSCKYTIPGTEGSVLLVR